MYDVWDVIGLSGTGTDSYSVDNLFIPEKFAALRDDPTALREKGPALRASPPTPCSDWASARSRSASRAPRSMPPSIWRAARPARPQGDAREQRRSGRDRPHRGQFARGARLSLCHGRRGHGAISPTPESSPRITALALRLASTWTIHQAAAVVDAAYHMAGATAVFSANKFERRFRDMHAIAQQIQARDTHYEDVGKALLGTAWMPRGTGLAAKPMPARKTDSKRSRAPRFSAFKKAGPFVRSRGGCGLQSPIPNAKGKICWRCAG